MNRVSLGRVRIFTLSFRLSRDLDAAVTDGFEELETIVVRVGPDRILIRTPW